MSKKYWKRLLRCGVVFYLVHLVEIVLAACVYAIVRVFISEGEALLDCIIAAIVLVIAGNAWIYRYRRQDWNTLWERRSR